MNDLSKILNTLNDRQAEAVRTTEGPLLVLAGAGSGKTRVITVRIAYLIAEKGVPPHNILAVTFTNKAAAEMRSRVEEILRGERLPSAPLISTFHSLCVRILRQDIEALDEGYTRSFTIYDTDDSQKVIKACIKDLGFDEKSLAPRAVRAAISASKNRGEDHEIYASKVEYGDDKRLKIARIFKLYDERLGRANALDFDDLLLKAVRLLKVSSEVREKYNDRFRYILVDEYQDTNSLQLSLIRSLTEKSSNICVVGDDAQSIYGFRQADIRNILSFEEHFPDAKVILLEQNYRSTQTILDAADAIISNNREQKKKKLWTENPGGERIFYFQAMDGESEARFVVSKISDILYSDRATRVAVLYRTNAQSRLFEEALRRNRIDYNIVGGFSFYERAEIKDIVAYLKLSLNPFDDVALMRVINTPARGIGKTTLDELQRAARAAGGPLWRTIEAVATGEGSSGANVTPRAREALRSFYGTLRKLVEKANAPATGDHPVSDLVTAAIEETGYAGALRAEGTDEAQSRIENLEELVNAAVEYDHQEGNGLRDFIDHAALTSDTDKYDRDAAVTLMTIHAAKGLEFPVVFIVGLEDGVFPHSRSLSEPKDLEEERRLAYVAITRAEKRLYISHAMRRRTFGEEFASEPSQFLNELPLEMIEDVSPGPSWLSYAKGGTGGVVRESIMRPPLPPKKAYTGKTYNSADAIAEFFKDRGKNIGQKGGSAPSGKPEAQQTPLDRLKAAGSGVGPEDRPSHAAGGIVPGSYVIHDRYGRGLVLRREGSGDSSKLTVSFPGYGQKKLIEKFAGLRTE